MLSTGLLWAAFARRLLMGCLRISQICNESQVFPILFLIFPFSFHLGQTCIVPECRSCPNPFTLHRFIPLVIQCFLEGLNWCRWHWNLGSRTGSLLFQRAVRKLSPDVIRSRVSSWKKVTATIFYINFLSKVYLFVYLFSHCPTEGFCLALEQSRLALSQWKLKTCQWSTVRFQHQHFHAHLTFLYSF